MESYQLIPLTQITPSKTNPRKRFDETKLKELAESIRSKGVLQPVLVRPIGFLGVRAENRRFELVVGERRFRACKLAGLKEIPATVRELSDVEVLECQVVENDQREDTLPSERAAGYQGLVDAGVSIEDVAKKVGKSPSWVRSVLGLARLPKPVIEAVDAGKLPRSTAELIGRVPTEFLRDRVAECVLRGQDWWNAETFNDPKVKLKGQFYRQRADDEAMTYRDAKDLIQRCCAIELKSAPFDRKALNLLPGVGACGDCPKRAANMPELAADGIRGDVCMDPACYARKCEASGKSVKDKANKPAAGKTEPPKPRKKTAAQKAEDAKRREENRIEKAVRLATLSEIVSSAESLFADVLRFEANSPQSLIAELFRFIVEDKLKSTWGSAIEDICARRGHKGGSTADGRKALEKETESMGAVKLVGILAEIFGYSNAQDWGDKDLLKILGIDRKSIEKRVKDEDKAAKAAKAKPSANGTAKTKAKASAGV